MARPVSAEYVLPEVVSFSEDSVEDEDGELIPGMVQMTYVLISSDPVALRRWRNARRSLVAPDGEVAELKPAGKKA